jgi:sulfur transfer complex TusBCD TusB component (DsrH family)
MIDGVDATVLSCLLNAGIAPGNKPQDRVIRGDPDLLSKLGLPQVLIQRHTDVAVDATGENTHQQSKREKLFHERYLEGTDVVILASCGVPGKRSNQVASATRMSRILTRRRSATRRVISTCYPEHEEWLTLFRKVADTNHWGVMEKAEGHIRSDQSDGAHEASAAPHARATESDPRISLAEATKREQTVEADFFSSLLAQHREEARSYIEVYEAATDLVTAIDTLLVRHAEKSGFNREEEFNRFGSTLFKDGRDEVIAATEELTARYFTQHENKYTSVVTHVKEFISLMSEAQANGFLSGDLLARDAFKLIAQNITAISLQDKGSDVTTIVELDAIHLMEHDLQGCMQLADALIEQGGHLSPMDKLLLHQSAVYHRVGSMIPPVLQAIAQKGIQDKDLGIPMLTAHYIRSQYDDQSSVWHTIFSPHEFELLHKAVLYQEKESPNPSDMALQIGASNNAVRDHNVEAIVRISHTSDE